MCLNRSQLTVHRPYSKHKFIFQPFYFPSNAGFSFGAPDDSRFYIMEMHFDNPKQESGRVSFHDHFFFIYLCFDVWDKLWVLIRLVPEVSLPI